MTTVTMSMNRIAVTIPITIEMVDTSFPASLSDGKFVMVMLDDKFGFLDACFIVSSASRALTAEESLSVAYMTHGKLLTVLL